LTYRANACKELGQHRVAPRACKTRRTGAASGAVIPCLIQRDQRATGVPIEWPETNEENGEAWWIRTTDSLLKSARTAPVTYYTRMRRSAMTSTLRAASFRHWDGWSTPHSDTDPAPRPAPRHTLLRRPRTAQLHARHRSSRQHGSVSYLQRDSCAGGTIPSLSDSSTCLSFRSAELCSRP
jgi:hypothetical protein